MSGDLQGGLTGVGMPLRKERVEYLVNKVPVYIMVMPEAGLPRWWRADPGEAIPCDGFTEGPADADQRDGGLSCRGGQGWSDEGSACP